MQKLSNIMGNSVNENYKEADILGLLQKRTYRYLSVDSPFGISIFNKGGFIITSTGTRINVKLNESGDFFKFFVSDVKKIKDNGSGIELNIKGVTIHLQN